MDEKEAKKLVIKLTNAAYEAGLWKNHANKKMASHWAEKAEAIGDEMVRHLSEPSPQPDNSCTHENRVDNSYVRRLMETKIEVLKKDFTYGNAMGTHIDILAYLNSIGISKEEYSTWGRHLSEPSPRPDNGCTCSEGVRNYHPYCPIHGVHGSEKSGG